MRTLSVYFFLLCVSASIADSRQLLNKHYDYGVYLTNCSTIDLYKNGEPVASEDKRQEIENVISNVIETWTSLTGGSEGTIWLTYKQSATQLISIHGDQVDNGFGERYGWDLHLDQNCQFTLDFGDQDRHYLRSVLLHEFSHFFFGYGHWDRDTSVNNAPTNGDGPYCNCGTDPAWRQLFSDWDTDHTWELYNPLLNITLQNSFTEGKMYVGKSYVERDVPYSPLDWREATFPQKAMAKDQQDVVQDQRTYSASFVNWKNQYEAIVGNQLELSLGAVNATYTCWFELKSRVDFRNDFNGGNIKVKGSTLSSPSGTYLVGADSNIQAEAITPQYFNGVTYTFLRWTDGTQTVSTSANYTFTPDGQTTYTAEFAANPDQVTGITFSSSQNGYIRITWDEHPSSDVGYKIYRQVGKFGSPEYWTTLNHGTTSWTDPEYTLGGEQLLYYDVRAYHTPSQTSANEHWEPTGGTLSAHKGGGDKKPVLAVQAVKEYSIGCYPNPFNPTTTISFALVENAAVKLEIYDVSGRKIRSLLDGQTSAGPHSIVWNGQDLAGANVSSSLYFYRFTAIPLSGQKAVLEEW